MSAMKSETLTKAVKATKRFAAESSVKVSAAGELITDLTEEETDEEQVEMLERIINTPLAAKSKSEDDDDDDDDDLDDDDFEDDDFKDEDFEEFDMPKSKPGAAGGAKKKDEDDFELEDDFDDFDDFGDDDDDVDF